MTCAVGLSPAYPEEFTYEILPMLDKPTQNISTFIEKGVWFLSDCFEKEGKALVHCFVGKSRSTTILVGYLMKQQNMDLRTALDLVKSKREIAEPNFGFLL